MNSMIRKSLTVYVSCERMEMNNFEGWAQDPQVVSSSPLQGGLAGKGLPF